MSLIHLWVMVQMATCYSVFVVRWLRTKVRCTYDHRHRFCWNLPSYSVSHVRWEPVLTRGVPIQTLDLALYPPTTVFLIKQPYEIVRLRSTQVQIGGAGARVPYGLCTSLRGPTQAG